MPFTRPHASSLACSCWSAFALSLDRLSINELIMIHQLIANMLGALGGGKRSGGQAAG